MYLRKLFRTTKPVQQTSEPRMICWQDGGRRSFEPAPQTMEAFPTTSLSARRLKTIGGALALTALAQFTGVDKIIVNAISHEAPATSQTIQPKP